MADQLAKEGREKEQPSSHRSCREAKTLIHNKKKAIFHCKTGGYNPNQHALHQLSRHQQAIIFHLRTGHCRLNSHLKRFGVKTSAQCPCGEADQTPKHYLQSCSLHQQSKAADMAHLCVPQNQALGVCRGFVPDIQVCGTHGREDLVNATITSNEEEVLVKLRTGHNRLNSHTHGKLKLAYSPVCLCGQEDQTTEHVLQRCPLHKVTRDVWPVPLP